VRIRNNGFGPIDAGKIAPKPRVHQRRNLNKAGDVTPPARDCQHGAVD
jgi:hypothetical protein